MPSEIWWKQRGAEAEGKQASKEFFAEGESFGAEWSEEIGCGSEVASKKSR